MPGSNSNLIESLRGYILDLKEFNDLNLNEEELDSTVLSEAVQDGIQRYDLVPPFSTTDQNSIDITDKMWYLIKRCAAIEAFQRLIYLNVRNRIPVDDSGMIRVDEMSKANDWDAVKNGLIKEVQPKIVQYKRTVALMSMSPGYISMV